MAYKLKKLKKGITNKQVVAYYDIMSMRIYNKTYHELNGREAEFVRKYAYESLKK